MKIAFYASSLLSSYWNGAATYYRGLLHALAARGYAITFYEPDVYGRGENRDYAMPEWCEVVVYEGTEAAARTVAARAADADVVVKASGVGFADDLLLEAVLDAARPGAIRAFWDVDAPATLAEMEADRAHGVRTALDRLDIVFTYGGGDPVISRYEGFGARACVPIYNALDPSTHFPVPPEERLRADLAFLGNRLPDREQRVEEFFLRPAAALPDRSFLIGGSGWEEKAMPGNVRRAGHVPAPLHNAFNASPKAVLNIARDSMAAIGFSPATRVFEAAGAGACIITDWWPGIECFLEPEREILVARDGGEVADIVATLDGERARAIGEAARARVLRDHTYAHRATEVDRILTALAGDKRSVARRTGSL